MDAEILEEFYHEAKEIFEDAEDSLLSLESGGDFQDCYNATFRAFHSIKGAAGMFDLEVLQKHMHTLENQLESYQDDQSGFIELVDYFLKGLDAAKSYLAGGPLEFEYRGSNDAASATVEPTESQIEIPEAQVEVAPVSEELTPNGVTEIPTEGETVAKSDVAQVEADHDPELEKRIDQARSKLKSEGLIYVVDDEEDILFLLGGMLEDYHYTVKTFTNANDMIGEIKLKQPDIILSDFMMPEMNGEQMITALRGGGFNIPVIFISGYLSNDVILKLLGFGAFGFINKPFEETAVISMAKNAMEKVKSMRLLLRTIKYLTFQFADLDNYLKEKGKESLRKSLKDELNLILEQKKIIEKF